MNTDQTLKHSNNTAVSWYGWPTN